MRRFSWAQRDWLTFRSGGVPRSPAFAVVACQAACTTRRVPASFQGDLELYRCKALESGGPVLEPGQAPVALVGWVSASCGTDSPRISSASSAPPFCALHFDRAVSQQRHERADGRGIPSRGSFFHQRFRPDPKPSNHQIHSEPELSGTESGTAQRRFPIELTAVRPSMLEPKTRCGRGPTHTIAACKPRRE